MGVGCTGTDKDWDVLTGDPRKKLLVMMEVLRTAKERMTLRYTATKIRLDYIFISCCRFLARKRVVQSLMEGSVGKNPGSRLKELEIPVNLKQYIRHPV